MRANLTFFCLVAIAGIISAIFVVPYLRDTGHKLLCVPLFAFLAILAVYGRCNPLPRARKRKSVQGFS